MFLTSLKCLADPEPVNPAVKPQTDGETRSVHTQHFSREMDICELSGVGQRTGGGRVEDTEEVFICPAVSCRRRLILDEELQLTAESQAVTPESFQSKGLSAQEVKTNERRLD